MIAGGACAIRPAVEGDLPRIVALLDTAFAPSVEEGRLVARVAAREPHYFDWLMERDGKLLGYVLYTVAIREGSHIGFHLAPLAIAPHAQRCGLGSELLRRTLAEPPLRHSAVFVLGDRAFYRRFGFAPCRHARSCFDPSGEHFMALREPSVARAYDAAYCNAFSIAG